MHTYQSARRYTVNGIVPVLGRSVRRVVDLAKAFLAEFRWGAAVETGLSELAAERLELGPKGGEVGLESLHPLGHPG